MKKLTDKEIQSLLDDSGKLEESHEVELYQRVFRELSTLPDVNVYPLAKDVVKILQKRAERIATIKTYSAISLCITFSFCAFIAGAFVVDRSLALKLLSVLYSYRWVIVFLLIVFNAISVIERKNVSNLP